MWTVDYLKSDPSTIFLGTYGGGFYKTNNGGNTWHSKGSNVIIRNYLGKSVTAVKILDNDIYIGSTLGLFKSSDLGEHWESIFEPLSCLLTAIAIDHEQPDIIYISNYFGGGGAIFFYNGISKSIDGGRSWVSVDEQNIFLGTADGFYRSTNGGKDWKKYNNGLFAFDNTTLAFDNNVKPSKIFVGTYGAGIYVSDNCGENWVDMEMNSGFIRIQDLAISNTNSQIMYAGYIGLFDSVLNFNRIGILKSIDSGLSWCNEDNGLENNIPTSIVIDTSDEDILYSATFNGIYKSTNGVNNWIKKNQGMDEVGAIYSIAIDPCDTKIIYAGTQFRSVGLDQGIYKSIDGGECWDFSSIGLATYFFSIADICINPLNPNSIFAAVSWEGIYKSVNGGNSWFEINDGINNKLINSVAIDPTDTSFVYAAGKKIYMSENGGENWQEMMNGLPDYYGIINEIRVDPNDSDLIYATTNGYGVLKYYRKSTSVENYHEKPIPNSCALYQNYPNPFNPETEIKYGIAKAGKVVIKIYNVKGEMIKTLVNEFKTPGNYTIKWNGFNEVGKRVTSGVYLYQMVADNFRSVKKMVLTH